MTPFASVAIFRRNNQLTFKPPRKEPLPNATQARKAAARYWRGNIQEPDKLSRVLLVNVRGTTVHVAEREWRSGNRAWVEYPMQIAEALDDPAIAACLGELGVDGSAAPPPLPDTLEINGAIYVRQI